MDYYDPNTWTESFVRHNARDCMTLLRRTNEQVVAYLRQGHSKAAIAGLDRILNGLAVIHNAQVMDCRRHMCLFSWAEANIVCMGNLEDAPADRRRATAVNLFSDARDFATKENTWQSLREILAAVEGGMSFAELKRELEPNFPEETASILQNLNKQLVL